MRVRIEKFDGRIATLKNLEDGKDVILPTSLLPQDHRLGQEYLMERKGKVFDYQLLNPEDFPAEKAGKKTDGLKKKDKN